MSTLKWERDVASEKASSYAYKGAGRVTATNNFSYQPGGIDRHAMLFSPVCKRCKSPTKVWLQNLMLSVYDPKRSWFNDPARCRGQAHGDASVMPSDCTTNILPGGKERGGGGGGHLWSTIAAAALCDGSAYKLALAAATLLIEHPQSARLPAPHEIVLSDG